MTCIIYGPNLELLYPITVLVRGRGRALILAFPKLLLKGSFFYRYRDLYCFKFYDMRYCVFTN